jgi:peptidyl-prolyl cis-trans isomerase C
MLRYSLIALAFALSAVPMLASAEDSIATVNGKTIPKSRADALVAAQAASGQADTPELRKMVREELIRREILTQEALKNGVDKKPEILPQLMLARQGVLIQAYVGSYVRAHPITDDVLKKEYDAVKATLGDKEYKVRHILVKTQEEANDIIAKLNKGEKFEDLAKLSLDPSKDRGGELGWAAPSNFVKPFSAAMVKLEKGKYTEAPVQSEYGFHIIQVDDTRDLKLPAFDEAKAQIAQHMQQQLVEKHINELLSKSTVK